jgi:putative transposase
VDAQSQSAEPGVEDRGLDGGKKVNGRKRHIAVDTLGLMLICMCTSANTADSVVGQKLVELLNNRNYFPRLKKILGDNAYRGVGVDFHVGVTVEATERKEGQKGFVPEAFRWVVERTFA